MDNSQTPIWRSFVWKKFVRPHFSIHLWKTLYCRLSTDDNLQKYGFQVVSKGRLHESQVESLEHLLI